MPSSISNLLLRLFDDGDSSYTVVASVIPSRGSYFCAVVVDGLLHTRNTDIPMIRKIVVITEERIATIVDERGWCTPLKLEKGM